MGRQIFDRARDSHAVSAGHQGSQEFLEPVLAQAGLPLELADALEDATFDDARFAPQPITLVS